MSFFRRTEMDAWFGDLYNNKQSALELRFDYYYMCLMIGFASLRDDPLEGGDELVRYVPNQFAAASDLIIGLLLIAETQKLGKQLSSKRDVEFLVNQYLESSGSGSLNEAGFSRVNNYANGGFNYLFENHAGKPYFADTFFGWYSAQIQSLTAESPLWSTQLTKVL